MRERLLDTLRTASAVFRRASRASADRMPAVRTGASRAVTQVRRRPDVVLAVGLLAGVLAMILHWS